MDKRGHSKVDRLVDSIRAQVAGGTLKPGERLRSIREQAQVLGIAKNTVIEAYLRLVAQGVLCSKQGAGYFVSKTGAAAPCLISRSFEGIPDSRALLIEQLERRLPIRPGDGRLPAEWLADREMRRSLDRAKLRSAEAYNYNVLKGFPLLRDRLTGMLADRSIPCRTDQIVMTHGSNHAMDLIIRAYVAPGTPVLVEEPGYYPLFLKLELAGAHIVGVRREIDGPDPGELSNKVAQTGAKLFFTQSLAHNPSGSSTSLHKAHAILKIAETHDMLVVEDDPFADILPPSAPRLAALDALDRVIYLNTFSKTLAGSFRSGFIATSPDRAEMLADRLMISDISTSSHNERLIHALMEGAFYLKHLRRLTKRIEEAAEETAAALESIGLRVQRQDPPGIYLWARLPFAMPSAELVARAAEQQIFIAPADAFFLNGSEETAMRINIAYGNDPRFLRWLDRLIGW